MGATGDEFSEKERDEAQEKAAKPRATMTREEAEGLFQDADGEGFDESSPEAVTDDELFRE